MWKMENCGARGGGFVWVDELISVSWKQHNQKARKTTIKKNKKPLKTVEPLKSSNLKTHKPTKPSNPSRQTLDWNIYIQSSQNTSFFAQGRKWIEIVMDVSSFLTVGGLLSLRVARCHGVVRWIREVVVRSCI